MKSSLIKGVITWINSFLLKGGVTQLKSPATVVLGKYNPDYNKNQTIFGEYFISYIRATNTMKLMSVPAITIK